MRTFVWLVAFVTMLTGFSSVASAQNITLGTAPDREDNDYDGELEYYISRADCDQDEVFTFSYTATLANVSSLQIWVGEGADCRLIDEREGVDAGCQHVRTIDTPDQNDTIDLTASEIAGAHKTVTGCDDSSASTDPHQTEIYFLLIRGSGVDVEAADHAVWTGSKVDLLGPKAPVVDDFSAADESVTVDIELSGDAGDQYQAFCNPKPAGSTEPQSRPFGGATGGGGAGGAAAGGGGASAGGGGAAAGGGGAAAGGGGAAAGGGGAAAGGGGASAGGAGEGGGGGSVPAPDCDAGDLLSGQIPPATAACGELVGGPGVTVTGLDNGTEYAIGIAAVDELGNYGELSEIVCVSPVAVDDFFDNYKNAGGQGGCIGGCAVSETPLSMSAVAGALALFALAVRRRRTRALGKVAGPLALLLALAHASPASAQGIPDSNWRQTDRPAREPADTQFAFEVRFGPYWPQVDSESGLSGTPYEDTFGTDGRFYFGLEFDWMPLRIPYVGTFGVGVGWGYTWASANALRSGCDPTTEPDPVETSEDDEDLGPCETTDVTSLEIFPMHASAVLRADELMRRTGVPLVPYGKFGFGWAFWRSGKTAGVSSLPAGQDGNEEDDLYAEDVTIGLHAGLGLALALNWLDTHSAGSLRESTGIGHAYLFAEWMNALLNGFGGGQMHVGTSTFVTGLAFDF